MCTYVPNRVFFCKFDFFPSFLISSHVQIVELLLANGAHIDARNASSQRPSDLLRAIPGCKINLLHFTTLRCLAAAAISKHSLPYKREVPKMLEDFVEVH